MRSLSVDVLAMVGMLALLRELCVMFINNWRFALKRDAFVDSVVRVERVVLAVLTTLFALLVMLLAALLLSLPADAQECRNGSCPVRYPSAYTRPVPALHREVAIVPYRLDPVAPVPYAEYPFRKYRVFPPSQRWMWNGFQYVLTRSN